MQRVEQLEHDLLASQQAQREMENDLFRAREMLMDAEARLFSMGEDKARLQAERDSAEAAVLAFNFLRSGKVSSKPLSLSSSNRQLPPLPASLELLAFDMKDSSASALQQAQALFDSLTSLAACSQLFSAALDLCERSIMHASEQGLRMSNELRYLTEQCSSKAEQSSELFAQQLEANSASAVVIAARMHDVMMAMKAQHSDLTSRYETFLSQYTVFEHAVAEADKGAKHLQVCIRVSVFVIAALALTLCAVAGQAPPDAAQRGQSAGASAALAACSSPLTATRRRQLLMATIDSHVSCRVFMLVLTAPRAMIGLLLWPK